MANTGNEVIVMTEKWFAKAPALPTNAREILVKIAPYIALIFGFLGIVGVLGAFGLLTAVLPMAALGGVSGYGTGYLAAIFLIASSALMLAAFPGLNARKMSGWTLLFWSEVLNIVYSIVSLSFISGIIGALICFYILFQIKSYYK